MMAVAERLIIDSGPQASDVKHGANRLARYVWAVARIAVGWTFLWAFLDKTFGLGYSTESEQSWLNGGHPTRGFLSSSATGPFDDFYRGIAGDSWADWLFMVGLLGIGLALMSGVGVRIAAASGALLLTMMWSVTLPPVNNPVLDDHIVMAIVLVGLAVVNAGSTLGFGHAWARVPIVRRWPFLR